MRILCGTDIIEIERIKKSIERSGSNFLNLIYTPKEIEYCESTRNAKYCHYAGRFASKEAIFKTVSALLPDKFGISWKDVQIVPELPLITIMNFLNVLNQRLVTLENVVVIPDGKGKMINVTDYYAMQAEEELKARAEAAAKEQEQTKE